MAPRPAPEADRSHAWDGYTHHRKAPLTHSAGRGYVNPTYDLSDEWRAAREAIRAAQEARFHP